MFVNCGPGYNFRWWWWWSDIYLGQDIISGGGVMFTCGA
jgi:hypothetical protein